MRRMISLSIAAQGEYDEENSKFVLDKDLENGLYIISIFTEDFALATTLMEIKYDQGYSGYIINTENDSYGTLEYFAGYIQPYNGDNTISFSEGTLIKAIRIA